MKKIIVILMLVYMSVSSAMAQKTCVIANAEDHVPIREALIHTDNNHWARTDYRGCWTMKYQFDSAMVSKSGFLKTTIYLKELPDTLFMIPESHQIGTVEVWGKNQEHMKEMKNQFSEAAAETGRNAALGKTRLVGFDLGNILDGKGRRDRRHLKKAQKILGVEETKDPIVSAYEQATGKKYVLQPPHDVSAEEKENAPSDESVEQERTDGKVTKKRNVTMEIDSTVGITK